MAEWGWGWRGGGLWERAGVLRDARAVEHTVKHAQFHWVLGAVAELIRGWGKPTNKEIDVLTDQRTNNGY